MSGLTTAETVVAPPAATMTAADGTPRGAAPANDAGMTATTGPELPMTVEEFTVTHTARTGPVTADATAMDTAEVAVSLAAVAELDAGRAAVAAATASLCNAVPQDVAAAMSAAVATTATMASVVERSERPSYYPSSGA